MTELHAVSYARVSSREQEQGYSIPAQQKALINYAVSKQIQIVREFVDVETAKESGRAAFGEMLTFLRRSRSVRVLLVEKTDRLYRNVEDWVLCEQVPGLSIHFVKEGSIVSRESRSHEKFFHGIRVLMAKNYVDNLSEEARKGMEEKASQGLWPSAAPTGFKNVLSDNGRRVIEVDRERAPIIAEMFSLYAGGDTSIGEIAEWARRNGLVHKRSGKALARSNIHVILSNPIYAGKVKWRGVVYEGKHEPIVSQDLFDRAQLQLRRHSVKRTRGAKDRFAYAGLVRCGHCGCLLTGQRQKARYIYYHCTGWRGNCHERYVREEVLDERFAQLLSYLDLSPSVTSWMSQAVCGAHLVEADACRASIRRLNVAVERLESRLRALYVDKLDGSVSELAYGEVQRRTEAEREGLVNSLQHQEAMLAEYMSFDAKVALAVPQAGRLFRGQADQQRRELLNAVLVEARWASNRLSLELKPPFCWLPIAGGVDGICCS